MDNRTKREKKAYDADNINEINSKWHIKFSHVYKCPNTIRYKKIFYALIRSNIPGKKVLEIGCGRGNLSQQLFSFGANYVYGIDLSEKFISEAKNKEIPGKLEFSNKDVVGAVEGLFDIICGSGILHHINYKPVLNHLYSSNLTPGGLMIFREPLGSNLFMKLWFALGKKAHTPDERPFYKKDLEWLENTFRCVDIIPINFFSFPAGILSSIIFSNADNFIMQLCDKIDYWIAKNIKLLHPNFRQALIIIKKDITPT